ncbi:type I restriction enzyme HsdR N-terminal domain-containing protein [Algoriphagus sp. AK58]|uniref:type I restriction enzyme HsdR N-terminal domain-containing protein n=1 Tax=Algoriphagus sp. AK58 TaxID=1406877 RepID=UPI00164FA0EE|nr:type I restriction enzyme HsdR N-terminal domain-containing protein [Algoriphagus sp. AK58]MBC6368819.1 type I restriction endonuclease subunit R [Algoriphagus sp. AK58]
MNSSESQKIKLPGLDLPHFEPNLRVADGKLMIFDPLRKKFVSLTPEEWVRQHWINFLVNHHQYPKGLFSLEKGLKYNQLQKRTDLVVFDRAGKPYLLIECKAPYVTMSEQTLSQAMAYNNVLNCPNLILSNGIKHFYMVYSFDEKKFIERKSLPESPK